ncbi:MAG: hypothetical protein GY873_20285, partial [Bosea sp.]|uniref:hypothetical protein n=1 Tax=Bosea sp. (in: a-proteobacteria) TaxID=1871050 RepID=UPI00239EF401|nr:hypothetical protein [Bosea sp. (in: a-proteobacteria)]
DADGNPVIPPYVQDQMRHQLIVSGLSAGYAVALHGDFGVDVIRYEIEETSEHLSRVLDMARRVEEQDEPTPTGADLADVLADSDLSDAPAELSDPDVVGLTMELSNLDKRISRLNKEIKPMDQRRREIKAQIAVAVADLGGRAVCDGREWYVSETPARTVERTASRQLRSRKWKGGAL